MNNTVILITSNGMGKSDERLGQTLAGKYFELLSQNGSLPAVLCFYTEGVKLVCDDSPILDQLRKLEANGVRLIVCSTCLNYYELNENVQVGIVGGMGDILEAQVKADKVITI